MDLRQLRYLVAVADELHFTRAAAREHVAQPALSQQIRRLKEEVGLPLVERSTRRVVLTEAGETLVAGARRMLAELEATVAELNDQAGVRAGHLAIGATGTLGPVDVSRLVAAFHDRYPGVDLTMRERPSNELSAMLRRDEIDFAFLSVTERIARPGLEFRRLIEEEVLVVLPAGHELAGRASVRLADLAGETFVSFLDGARLRELLVTAARDAGFEPHVAFESDQVRRIRDMVGHGLGVTILPRSDVSSEDDARLAVVRLVDPTLRRDVTLGWRAERRLAPAARAFLEMALEVGSEPSRGRRRRG
jgi:LysR family transcriptional regulator, transcription activator of glutamate synthase operon